MDQMKTSRFHPELSLTAILSSGLTLVLTLTYTVLCALALVYRFQCDTGLASGATGSSYFIDTVYRVYIQAPNLSSTFAVSANTALTVLNKNFNPFAARTSTDVKADSALLTFQHVLKDNIFTDSCDNADSSPPPGVTLMNADTVFIFVLLILILSVVSCAAAIVLIVVVVDEKKSRYIFATAWAHICISSAATVVDVALAISFGSDYAKLSDAMDNSLPGIIFNYRQDVLRMGSQLLMAVALKGYLAHVVNVVLLTLLAVYARRFKDRFQTDEHAIHKRGAINAYELHKREDVWHNQHESDLPFTRGPHLNAGYEHEPRSSPRSPARAAPVSPISDYSNRDYDRSDSWQHSQGGSRPFSYTEEPRRARAAPPPAPAEPWRRDPWPPAPPVPAPDYSPPSRRLKSALKPNYM